MAEYNGYPNRETYVISLILDNNEAYVDDVKDIVKRCYGDMDNVAKMLKDWVEGEVYNLLQTPTIWHLGKDIIDELLDMAIIDWDYLAQGFIDEYEEVDETDDMTD